VIIDPERMKVYYEFAYPFIGILSIGIIVANGVNWLMKWYKKKKEIKNERN